MVVDVNEKVAEHQNKFKNSLTGYEGSWTAIVTLDPKRT
jgi:hypothetical protein